MTTATLDTHRVVKRLQQAGFSDAQAETVTDLLIEAGQASMAELATKADMAELRGELGMLRADVSRVEERLNGRVDTLDQRLSARIDGLEQRLNARFESLEQRMTIKLGSMPVAAVALMAVLVKLL